MMKKSKKSLKRLADKLFSQWIRSEGQCEWCNKVDDTLQCAHIFSRRYLVTRWDKDNALCLCAGCHRKAHDKPLDFAEFVRDLYGREKYEVLMYRAHNIIGKPDLNAIITKYTKLLK